MPNILLVTFDFPPSNRVAVQRSLHTAYHLNNLGWDVRVLTVKDKCYDYVDHNLFYPENIADKTYRVSAINSRKIGYKGKYIDFLTIPDEWISWLIPALIKGRALIKAKKPDFIWSTCPPFTPHLIAGALAKRYNIKWIADYRDPAGDDLGKGVLGQHWGISTTDKFTVKNATRVAFTTEESRKFYMKRYPELPTEKLIVIPNGYYDLPDLERDKFNESEHNASKNTKVLDVLYSGTVYGARDPSIVFQALAILKKQNILGPENFCLTFQGPGLDKNITHLIEENDIADVVVLESPVGFKESIQRMHMADALFLIQGENFNFCIPAKAYEYIVAQRSILGLCDSQGATAKLLAKIPGASVICSVEDAVIAFKKLLESDGAINNKQNVIEYSRGNRTKQLADEMLQLV